MDELDIEYEIFSDIKPNPTVENIHDGYDILKENNCDCVVSIGGGSPQDAAKGIAILGSNGGVITDYNGVNLSKKNLYLSYQLTSLQEQRVKQPLTMLLQMKNANLKWL